MATIWTTTGESTVVTPNNGWVFSLEEMKKIIGGGYIEMVRLDEDTIMVVDEDGLNKGLPLNQQGAHLYSLMCQQNGHGHVDLPIVGDILVCSRFEAGYPWYTLATVAQRALVARGITEEIKHRNDG